MATKVEHFTPSDRGDRFESFTVRDGLTRAWIEFGADIPAIRRATSAIDMGLFVRAGPGDPPLLVRIPLNDASDLANRVSRMAVAGGDATITVRGPESGCALTFSRPPEPVVERAVAPATVLRLDVRQTLPHPDRPPSIEAVFLSIDEQAMRELVGNLRLLAKVIQRAERGGYDQPAGWLLGPMGSWTRIESVDDHESGLESAQRAIPDAVAIDQVSAIHERTVSVVAEHPRNRSAPLSPPPSLPRQDLMKWVRRILPVAVGIAQVAVILLIISDLPGIMDFLGGVPVVGPAVRFPGVGVLIAITAILVGLNLLAIVATALTLAGLGLYVLILNRIRSRV